MKVQNEMSTRISVDAVSAVGSLSAFRNAIRGASNAWRAQEVALRNSGNYTEAAKTRLSGLNQVIDLQKAKIEELRSRQEGLNLSNEKQANQFLKLETQIQSANKQLSSYESQVDRAKQTVTYYASGLAGLQHQMKMSEAVSRSYVASLRAQGETSKADRSEFSGLRESLSSLEKQQSKQRFLLKQVEQQSGKTSDAYRKQQIELNKTGETIAKTQSQMKKLDKALNPPRVGSWQYFRDNILRVDEAEKKARTSAINYGQALKANILGGWISSGLINLTTGIKSVITNGYAAAQAGAAMEARWKNIGVAASSVKQLSAQVNDLKTNTYLSAQSVNALQTRFYGMTHSISQTKQLTQSVGSLSDKLKLSEQQSNAFASGLSRIESSGKVSSATLGRLEKQAPGLTAALQRASGMSKQAFDSLLSSGKMTADQFNQLMVKASGDYKKNAASFSQTSGGAMHKLQAEWATTQAKLAKPLLKVSSTGLNELSQALNNKDTLRGLQMLAKGMADAAVNAAKFIGFIGKHQGTVKAFGGTILGLAAAYKTMQGVLAVKDVVGGFAKLKGTAKVISLVTNNVKLLGTAVKIATLGFNPWVIAIEAVVAGFTLLYKHSTKFRHFVNGLAKSAKSGMHKVGQWFSSTFKKINSDQQKSNREQQKANQRNQRAWNNYWKQHNSAAEQNRRKLERSEQESQRRRSRAIANFNRNLIRGSQDMWRQLQRHTQSGERNAERAWNNMGRRIGRTSSSLWRNMSRGARDGWRDVERAASDGSGRVSRWYDQMNKSTSRTIQNMRQQHPRTFGAMYKAIEDRSGIWHDLVTGRWSRLSSDTQRTAQDMRQQHPKLFDAMYKVVEDRSSLWHDVTTGHWNRVSGDTQHLASDMSDAHRQLFGAMYDKLNDLTHGGLDQMRDYWSNILNKIHDAVVNIGGTIHQAFDSLMNGLIDIFSGLVNGIVDGINWVLNHVGGDGNLQKVNLKHFAKGSNGPIDKHQLAVLNDASDNDYREMVHKHKTGETFMLPAKRNIMMPLEPGDEVLDGKRAAKLMKLMGTPVHHADGAIGDFFSGIFDKSKDALEDATDWVDQALKNVVGFGKSLFSHFMKAVTPKSTDSLNSALKINLPGFFANRLKDWLKKQLDLLNTDNPPGTGVERWRPVILRAFDALHVAPADWKVNKLLRQIQTESGGVPDKWQQVHDVNSGGNEARGLLQFAGSTWRADALPGHTDWRKGYNEILAAIHVLENGGEGGWGNVGNGHGWANGGLVNQHGLYEVAENNNPEMIVPLDPNKRGRAYQLLSQVIAQFRNEDGNSSSSVDDQASQQIQNLGRKFDALLAQNQQMINLIDKLIGVTDSVNNPTARYRRTQRDINMAQAQSLIR